jgi:hypothetical protein
VEQQSWVLLLLLRNKAVLWQQLPAAPQLRTSQQYRWCFQVPLQQQEVQPTQSTSRLPSSSSSSNSSSNSLASQALPLCC